MDKKQITKQVLLVDAGNSAMKWAISPELVRVNMQRVSYPENTSDINFKNVWDKSINPAAVFVSCVANELVWKEIEDVCQAFWQIEPVRVVSPQQGLGVTNAYRHAENLGSDRWCAILAAHQQAENSASVVVDCGTAITIDIVDPAGQHRGGYILPGIVMMQQSLGMQTARISLDQNETPQASLAPADSTTGCVTSGILQAAVAAIEATFMAQQKDYDSIELYLTGGDAGTVSALLAVQHRVIPELVLQGLALIAAAEADV